MSYNCNLLILITISVKQQHQDMHLSITWIFDVFSKYRKIILFVTLDKFLVKEAWAFRFVCQSGWELRELCEKWSWKKHVLSAGYKWHLSQKKWECLKMFLMLLRDQTMDYKETKNVVEGLCEWEILDLEHVKYLNFFKMSHNVLTYLPRIYWRAVNQSGWQLFLTFSKDVSLCVYTLKAIGDIQLYWDFCIFCPI